MDFLNYLKVYEKQDTTKVESLIEAENKKLQMVFKEAFYGEFVSKAEATLRVETEFVDSQSAPESVDSVYVKENLEKIKTKIDNLSEGEIKIIIHNNETPKGGLSPMNIPIGGGCGGSIDVEMEEAKPKKKRGRPKKQVGGPVEDRVAVESEEIEEKKEEVEESKEEIEEKKEDLEEKKDEEVDEAGGDKHKVEEEIEEENEELQEETEEEAEEDVTDEEDPVIKWSDIEDKLDDIEDKLETLINDEGEESEEVEEIEGDVEVAEESAEEIEEAKDNPEEEAYDMLVGGASVEDVISKFPDIDPEFIDALKSRYDDEMGDM